MFLVYYVSAKDKFEFIVDDCGEVVFKYKNSVKDTGEKNSSVVRKALQVWRQEVKPCLPKNIILWCDPERESLKKFYKKVEPDIFISRDNKYTLERYFKEKAPAFLQCVENQETAVIEYNDCSFHFEGGFLDSISTPSKEVHDLYEPLYSVICY